MKLRVSASKVRKPKHQDSKPLIVEELDIDGESPKKREKAVSFSQSVEPSISPAAARNSEEIKVNQNSKVKEEMTDYATTKNANVLPKGYATTTHGKASKYRQLQAESNIQNFGSLLGLR